MSFARRSLHLYNKVYRKLDRRLANKLILTFSLLVFLILFMVISVSYLRTVSMVRENYIQNSKRELRNISAELESYVTQMDDFSLTLRKDEQFMNHLLADSDNFESQLYIENQLKNMFYSRKDIEELSFYVPRIHKMYNLSVTKDKLEVKYVYNLEAQVWYQVIKLPPRYRSIEPSAFPQQTFFTFHRALINLPERFEPIGVLSIMVNTNKAKQLTVDMRNHNGEWMGIYDSQNRLYFMSAPRQLSQGEQAFIQHADSRLESDVSAEEGNPGSSLGIYQMSENKEWKLIKLIPSKVLSDHAEKTRNISLLLGMGALILFIPLIVFIVNAMTRKLQKLSNHMEKMGDANFNVLVDIDGYDEISSLSGKFNAMVIKIKDLIDEEYKTKLNEKNARMKALEAQLNPHFLYNSLQAISTKAMISGAQEVQDMVEALAYALRYTIKAGNLVTIRQEMEHVGHYLVLQKARFGDKLNVEVKLEDEIYKVQIPKLAIQTLVENAIKHGLEQSLDGIKITIGALSTAKKSIIVIKDNGPGLSPEKLCEIEVALDSGDWMMESTQSMGLVNLNSRLKLLIGTSAHLRIKGTVGQGTEVHLIVPH